LPVLKNYFLNRRQLAMLRKTIQVQVASSGMHAEYLRHGFAEAKVKLNPYPATCVADTTPPSQRPISGTVAFVGRLTSVKGGDYLIRALDSVRRNGKVPVPLRLEVAGAGPDLPRLRELANKLAVPAQFYGWLGAGEVENVMRQADLLAVPSLWPEPFGLVGLEAGCMGVPSVGYAHGGITDWLVDGKSGALAPSPPTVAGLADAIVRALADPQRHHVLRVGAWEIAKRFSVKRHLAILAHHLRFAAQHQPPPADLCPVASCQG
jgi:glycosyltransferase involved in cell wall biosynthesis